jgi:hypothetical protein
LRVKLIDAYVYHYGWVREPTALHKKIQSNIRLYRNDINEEETPVAASYEYDKATEPVLRFEGTHPALMRKRILRKSWPFNPHPSLNMPPKKINLNSLSPKGLVGFLENIKTIQF